MAYQDNYKKKVKTSEIAEQYGKMPPQALELEEAVLGAIMLEKDAIMTVIDLLSPDSFYHDAHKDIYSAILDLSRNLKPIDILTVTEELKKNGKLEAIGGPFYITQLTSKVASAAHIEFHARIIAQKHIQRELISVSSEIQERSFDDSIDVDELLDFSEQELFNIAHGNIKKETQKVDAVIEDAIRQIEEASKKEDGLSGVPSGFSQLDRLTSGWQPSDMVIIAARPSMGKTAFVLSMARNMTVEHKKAVAVFSLEMSALQLVNRLIVSETELPSDRIRNGRLEEYEWSQLHDKLEHLNDAPLYIDDTPAISIFELRAKCRRLKSQYDIDLVIIDYLQLMTGTGDSRGNREQEVSTISRSLKAIAKELNIPIIALSQLNRSVEMRSGDKRPQLSDLRESGAIEQDADLVLFIHRLERFGIMEDEQGVSTKNRADIIVAKHRNGAIGDITLKFRSEFARFEDLEEEFLDDFSGNSESITYSSKMNDSQIDLGDPGMPPPGDDLQPF